MNKDEKLAKRNYKTISSDYSMQIGLKKFPKSFFNDYMEIPAMLEAMPNVNKKKILDWGCGLGKHIKFLRKKGAIVKGFDISPQMVNIAREINPNIDIRVGSGNNIPFKEKFDVVMASLSLHYLNNWERVFTEIERVLKPHGLLVAQNLLLKG